MESVQVISVGGIEVELKLVGCSVKDSKYIIQLVESKAMKRVSRLSIVFKL